MATEEELQEAIKKQLYGNLFSGITTGATTGATIGSVIPGVGTAIGGVLGGLAGLIAGAVQQSSDKKTLEEAYKRDEELAAKLEGVDNFKPFLEAINARTVGREQEAEISTRQAAARGGLSEAAQEDLAMKAKHLAGIERGTSLAQAVPLAAQADALEKSSILNEEITRQELANDAMQGSDILSSFGNAAAALSAIALLQNESGNLTKPATGGASAARADASSGGTAPAGGTAATPTESAAKAPVGATGATAGASATSATAPATATAKSIPTVDQHLAEAERVVKDALSRTKNPNDPLFRYSVTGLEESINKTKNLIKSDLELGLVSEIEYRYILSRNPNAILSPEDWRNAVSTLRAGPPVNVENFDLFSDEELKAFVDSLMVK